MIRALIVIRTARFDAQDQILTLPQIDALRNRRRDLRIQRQLQQRPQRAGGEHIDVAVEVLRLHRDQQIARRTGERVIVIRHARIAEIARSDLADNIVAANG